MTRPQMRGRPAWARNASTRLYRIVSPGATRGADPRRPHGNGMDCFLSNRVPSG
jgi:hypothetical protein